MTEDQLREIPYTIVETAHAAKRSNFNSLKVHKTSQNIDRVDRIRRLESSSAVLKQFSSTLLFLNFQHLFK
jgi:hypothetical protein